MISARTRRRHRDAVADRLIVITGGARGIGRELAERLGELHARVVIGDVDADEVGKAAADLGIDGLTCDVTHRADFDGFLAEIEERHGPIDVLVNNAGIMPVGRLGDTDDRTIRRTLDVDLYGVIVGTQLALARMAERGCGQVVNVASVAGRLPTPGLAVYNAAKAGVIEFSEAVDAEFDGSGVRVSAVLPTFTRTGLIAGLATNRFVRTVAPEQVVEQIVDVIARPRVRVTAPRSMRWVDLNPMIAQPVKRRLRKLTKLDSIFVDYDQSDRAEYAARIRGD